MMPPTSCSAQSNNQKQQRSLVNALAIGIIKLQAAVGRSLEGFKKHHLKKNKFTPHFSGQGSSCTDISSSVPSPLLGSCNPSLSITKGSQTQHFGQIFKLLQGINTAQLPADPGAGTPDLWGGHSTVPRAALLLVPSAPARCPWALLQRISLLGSPKQGHVHGTEGELGFGVRPCLFWALPRGIAALWHPEWSPFKRGT